MKISTTILGLAFLLFFTANLMAEPAWVFSSPIENVGYTNLNELTPGAPVSVALPMATPQTEGAMMAMSAESAPVTDNITELAAMLQHDPKLIYEFVRNNISYDFYYGWLKGAKRTLLDMSGNDADQACLMVELLRASGYQANYLFGAVNVYPLTISGYDLLGWINTTDTDLAKKVLDGAGIPCADGGTYIQFVHIWVRATIGGATFDFDPSFKPEVYDPNADIGSMSDYDRAALLSAAGGTVGTDDVENLDETVLRAHLTGLTSNLVSSMKSDFPNGSFEDIIKYRKIVPEHISGFSNLVRPTIVSVQELTSLAYANFVHYIKIPLGSLTTTQIATVQFGDNELTIQLGSNPQYGQILSDDTEIYNGLIGKSVDGAWSLVVEIDHPYTANSGTYADDQAVYTPSPYGTYALEAVFGNSISSGLLDRYRQKLAMKSESGANEELLRRSLHVIAASWMHQTALINMLATRVDLGLIPFQHRLGLCQQTADGFGVDIKAQFGRSDGVSVGGILTESLMHSAMEHGVLEQLQGGDVDAVSTVKLLALTSRNGHKVFKAHSSNFASVKPQLKNYTLTELQKFQDAINAGSILILPEYGDIALQNWSGHGYIDALQSGGTMAIGMRISGGLDGGFNTNNEPLEWQQIYWLDKPWETAGAGDSNPIAADPVDMVTGAYLFDHQDLGMGGPLGLSMSRHYSSKSHLRKTTMGHGWNHSFDIYGKEHSIYEAGIGMRSMEDSAPILIASKVIEDVMNNDQSAKAWLVASLAAQWAVDQLTDNAVSIYVGSKVMTFIEQPDGSYTPPPGMTTSLAKANGLYVMQERHGNRYEFDVNLNLVEIEDQHGNTLTFGYNAQTNLQAVTSSFGPVLTFGYTGDLLTSVTDNSSPARSISYQYDSANNLTNCVDAAGYNWGVGYDSEHRVKWMKDPELGTTIQNFYNSIGQVTNQISSSGHPWDFYFTGTRNVSEDPLGNQTAYYLDSKARTWSIELPNGARSYSVFDGQNHVVQSVAPNSVTNAFVYDVNHNLLLTTNAVGLPEQVVSAYGYDSGHHLRFVTNALGTAQQTVTETTYTAEHKVDTVTAAKGTALATVTDYDYTSDGLVQQVSEGDGKRITTFNYDSNSQYGHPKTTTSTDAGTATTIYDIQGNLKSQTVDGKTTEFSYDARRLPTEAIYAKGTADEVSTLRTYWKNGLLKTATDARGKTSTTYWTDAYKQAGTVFPDTGSTTNLYDAVDRMVRSRDAEGNWATNTLDSVGQVVAVNSVHSSITNQFDIVGNLTNSLVDPSGLGLWMASTYDSLSRLRNQQSAISNRQFEYDSLGRTTNSVDAAEKNWKTEYDALGRVKQSYRPSGNYEEYGYDALGNRTHFWNAEFKPMTFGVDVQGRVVAVTNAIGKVTAFDFDDAGNLKQRTAADLSVTDYGYDALNRLVAVTNQAAEVAAFDHDDNGNVTLIENGDAVVRLGYDEMNQVSAVTQTVGSATFITGYDYDYNGNRTQIAYPGGTNAVYVYGADNRLESVNLSAFGISGSITFGYDGAGRMTNIVYPNGVTSTYGQDDNGNVTSIQHGSFVDRTIQRNVLGFKETELIDAGLKPAPPKTQRSTKSHNDADQIVSESIQTDVTNWVPIAYSYSANGCLTNQQSEIGSRQYQYDYDNRIVSAGGSGSVPTEYLYDASGARVGRIHNSTTNYFVVDYVDGLKRPLSETDASGTVTRYYVWAGSQLLCHIEANGDVFYYHADELGSTLALTDDTGTVTDQFAYMPYGYATHTGSTQTPYQWLGGYGVYYDSATQLHLTLHRAYSFTMKRFISADPLGIDGGVNVYAMANLNPLAFVDPYGLSGLESGSSGNWLARGANAYWQGMKYTYEELNRWSGEILYGAGQASEFLFDTIPTRLTGMDEYERFNVGMANGMNGDEFVYGALGMLTRGGRGLKWMSGIDDVPALPPPSNFADHHLFPRQYDNWFQSKGINNIDDFTVTVERNTTHLKAIHGTGNMGQMPGKWNQTWQSFIEANPNANAFDIYQQAGRMMDDYGLSGLPIHPYKQ
ncbi:MAG: DUF2380 domain-containing protein [Kiritimatiellales bacterium]|nr:DUF2380 domain-containing protein [Kiritimatiellales bacterium]MCF7864153.1 DUF2380 domain-containing protein [Kiritimatiellales bacterium]